MEEPSNPKTNEFEDVYFIPGQFIDISGKKLQKPQLKVKDVFLEFLGKIEGWKNKIWMLTALIIMNACLLLCIVLVFAWTVAVAIPMYQTVIQENIAKKRTGSYG